MGLEKELDEKGGKKRGWLSGTFQSRKKVLRRINAVLQKNRRPVVIPAWGGKTLPKGL